MTFIFHTTFTRKYPYLLLKNHRRKKATKMMTVSAVTVFSGVIHSVFFLLIWYRLIFNSLSVKKSNMICEDMVFILSERHILDSDIDNEQSS